MFLVFAALACTTPDAPEPVFPHFGPLVETDAVAGVLATVAEVRFGETTSKIGFHPIFETGRTYDGAVFGALIDEDGNPLKWEEGRDPAGIASRLCNVGDFGSLVVAHDQLFHLAHMECALGGISLAPLTQGDDGLLIPGAPHLIDLKEVHGGSTFCAGDITPWNTHLAGEEYDANARMVGPDGHLVASEMDMKHKHPSEWSFHNKHAAYRSDINPYDYGWMTEVEITDAKGATRVAKHYAMGRFSHELGLVMPDERTVYMTDDQYHAGFFLFVADEKGKLDAGTLYAARWRPSNDGLDWVSLGHATDAEIRATLFDKRPGFSDLFKAADLVDNVCPEGFGRTTTSWGTECLAVLDPKLASRLETRRFAGLQGATTEFTKNEGLALDTERGRLYVAMSKIDIGMLDETGKSLGPERASYARTPEQDHIKLDKNKCGIVFELGKGEAVDSGGKAIGSAWVMRTIVPIVEGRPTETGCDEGGISNPDNITFIEEYGLLVIAEDTSKHARDMLWVVDLRNDGGLVPLMAVDKASEVSGVHWFSDINGWSYLTVTNQWEDRDWPEHRTTMGFFGPFRAK